MVVSRSTYVGLDYGATFSFPSEMFRTYKYWSLQSFKINRFAVTVFLHKKKKKCWSFIITYFRLPKQQALEQTYFVHL